MVTAVRRRRFGRLSSHILAAMLGLMAVGCGSDDSMRRALAEIGTLQRELDELRNAQDASARELGRLSREMKALEVQAANLGRETQATREQVARVHEGVEHTEGTLASLRASLAELSRREVAPPPPPPPLEPRPKAEPPTRDVAAEKIYSAGLASFSAREHGQAVLEFTDLLTRFPRHPLAPNAQLWVGEAYYRQQDFRQALVEFQKVLDLYPKSQPVPDALLKIGFCHRALRDAERARQSWEQLVREHPGSDAAVEAKSLLASRGAPRGAR